MPGGEPADDLRVVGVGDARAVLGQPPLDTSGRDRDHVGGERVLERCQQRLGQAGGQPVRALGSVQVKHRF